MVAAILCPHLEVTLIESDQKKYAFLKAVSRETNSTVNLINDRIENVAAFPVDMITSRALGSLKKLLILSQRYISLNPALTMIFPKGANWHSEIDQARSCFTFDYETKASITEPAGVILIVKNLTGFS